MSGKLHNIQALRAIAVFLVMAIHMQVNELRASSDPLLSQWLYHGVSGVDVFFVISGFIMVWITRGRFGGLQRITDFLFSRATRIYPPAWIWTTVAIVAYAAAGNLAERIELHGLWPSYLLYPTDEPPLLGVSWTLIHELYFYLVFSLFLLGRETLLPVWLALWAGIVVAAKLSGLGGENPWALLVFHPLTLEFIAGAGAALILTRWRPPLPWLIFLAGVLAMAIGWIMLGERGPRRYPDEWGRVLAFGPGALLMVAGAAAMDLTGRFRPPALLTRIGDWSYTLYLSHLLVIATLAHGWMRFAADGVWDNLIMLSAMAILPLFVAAIAYYTIEKPVNDVAHRLRKRWFRSG